MSSLVHSNIIYINERSACSKSVYELLLFVVMCENKILGIYMESMHVPLYGTLFLVSQFGLRYAECSVREKKSEIIVCVEQKLPSNSDCPVAFPFKLHLSIESNSAGKNLPYN